MEIVLVALATIVAVAVVADVVGPRWRDSRLAVRRRVLVNLKTGNAFSGVILTRTRYVLIIGDALFHEEGSTGPVPVDGQVIVERSDVEFVQEHPERRT